MNHEQDDETFEQNLRRGLSALTAGCPAGPSGEALVARLHRRKARRRILAAATGAAALALVMVMVALQPPGPSPAKGPIDRIANDPQRPDQPAVVRSPAAPVTRPGAVAATAPGVEFDGVAWSSAAMLNLRQPAEREPHVVAAQPVDVDWNLSLSLSLASQVSDQAWTSLRFDSPAWR
jgi:hypothetical protein